MAQQICTHNSEIHSACPLQKKKNINHDSFSKPSELLSLSESSSSMVSPKSLKRCLNVFNFKSWSVSSSNKSSWSFLILSISFFASSLSISNVLTRSSNDDSMLDDNGLIDSIIWGPFVTFEGLTASWAFNKVFWSISCVLVSCNSLICVYNEKNFVTWWENKLLYPIKMFLQRTKSRDKGEKVIPKKQKGLNKK